MGTPAFDAAVIRAIYGERGRTDPSGVPVHYRGSSPQIQAGLRRRFAREEADALELLSTQFPGAFESRD